MCRLLGVIANQPVHFHYSLFSGEKSLRTLSAKNPDGWGLGYYKEERALVEKQPRSADQDRSFEALSGSVTSPLFISHVRLSSVGEVSRRNTHPFQHDNWLFAHNGTLRKSDILRQRLTPSHQEAVQGETDSEIYFHWILQHIESSGDVVEGIGAAVAELSDYHSINFLLSDGKCLYAYRDGYDLHYLERVLHGPCCFQSRELNALYESKSARGERAVLVCSEPLTEENWQSLDNGELLTIRPDLTLTRTALN